MYKNDDKTIKTNYRPATIASIFAKVYDAIISNQLMRYFVGIYNDM